MITRRRLVARISVGLAFLLVLIGAWASPAFAYPYWQNYSVTGKWHCVDHGDLHMDIYSCVVVNGNATQAVAIVGNFSGHVGSIYAPRIRLWKAGGLQYTVECYESTLNYPLSRACFGPTRTYPCGTNVQAQISVYATIWTGNWAYLDKFSRTVETCT